MIKKMSPSENDFNIPAKNCHRMVILGSTKVGKTAIISRFLNEKFDDQYTPTIEDFHRKLYSIRGDIYQLDILDTSGNHPFPAIRRLSILTGELKDAPRNFSLRNESLVKTLLYYLALKIYLLVSVQAMCSSWCSAWTTGTLFRRCNA